MKNFDRTVHAQLHDGGQVVRYGRAGRWYLEHPTDPARKRSLLTLQGAVDLARSEASGVFLGSSGGLMFDARYRAAR